ncbi:alpha/beta fold hydrolase [Streptomyces sp. NPDC002057]|uniref:thioesterase II family protein n=1 Tax=Streptomyces sp. NPDC002057 TaxID=3154664 RepID=UPI0033196228
MTNGTNGTTWLRRYSTTPAPRRRLVVLPHAGGTASFFHAWGGAFDGDTEVLVAQYPGRQERFNEPCVDRMDVLADRVTAALLPFADLPLTLFGHSMGASLAYEVALRLEERHHVTPAALHVSSRKAPHRVTPRDPHRKGDDELVAELRRLGGTDTALLDDPDIRQVVLPAVRADFTVVGTYGPRAATAVGCPVHAWIGDTDPIVAVRDMDAWADVAPHGFQVRVLPGGHFYLIQQHETLMRELTEHLAGDR